jgi:hypothetical protein
MDYDKGNLKNNLSFQPNLSNENTEENMDTIYKKFDSLLNDEEFDKPKKPQNINNLFNQFNNKINSKMFDPDGDKFDIIANSFIKNDSSKFNINQNFKNCNELGNKANSNTIIPSNFHSTCDDDDHKQNFSQNLRKESSGTDFIFPKKMISYEVDRNNLNQVKIQMSSQFQGVRPDCFYHNADIQDENAEINENNYNNFMGSKNKFFGSQKSSNTAFQQSKQHYNKINSQQIYIPKKYRNQEEGNRTLNTQGAQGAQSTGVSLNSVFKKQQKNCEESKNKIYF